MMRRKKIPTAARVLATLAVVLVSTGCAMKGDIRLVQEELRVIAARQDSLMQVLAEQTASTQDTLRTQGNQMFDLRGDLEAFTGQSFDDFWARHVDATTPIAIENLLPETEGRKAGCGAG